MCSEELALHTESIPSGEMMSSTAGAWELLWEVRISGDVQVQESREDELL